MEKQSLNIAGAGTVKGGEYENISIAGSAKILEDINANKISISGSSKIFGSVYANVLSVSGSCLCQGEIKTREVNLSGSIRLDRNCEGDRIRISGSVDVKGDLNFEEIEAKYCYGSFNNLYGDSITLMSRVNLGASVKEIEATSVMVENVVADRISGEDIEIGPGCKIGVVEYSQNLELSRKAEIGTIIKL